MDDNELMRLVREGSKEAYEILMKKYISQAKAAACKYVHDSHAAEDIVQESFADIYVQRFSFWMERLSVGLMVRFNMQQPIMC